MADRSERLIEIAVAAKRFWDAFGGDVYGLANGSMVIGAPSGVPVVQLHGFEWADRLARMATDGAEYRLSHGSADGREFTHLYVEVLGAWFWTSIGPLAAASLVTGQMEKAPAVRAAEAG